MLLLQLAALAANVTDNGGSEGEGGGSGKDVVTNATLAVAEAVAPAINAISVESIEHDAQSAVDESMFTDPAMLSLRQRRMLIVVSRLSCTLSGLGSLFIMTTFLTIPKLRRVFALQLVFFMAICELVNAFGVMIGSPTPDSDVCTTQSFIVAFSGLSSVLWTTVIANALYTSVVQPTKCIELARRRTYYHVYVWATTLVLVLLPTITDSYGFAGFNCWIKSDEVGQFWRFMQFYLPLWLAMFYNLHIYVVLYKTLISVVREYYHSKASAASGVGSSRSGIKLLYAMPLLLYPLNLLVCWIWGTMNRFQNWYHPGHPSYTLFVLQVLFGNLQGFFHFIAYLFSSNVRVIVMRRWTKFVEWHSSLRDDKGAATKKLFVDIFNEADDDDDDDDDEFEAQVELSRLLPPGEGNAEDAGTNGTDGDAGHATKQLDKNLKQQRQQRASLRDVSIQVRHAYVTSLGVYNLIGFDDNNQQKLYQQLSTLEQKNSSRQKAGIDSEVGGSNNSISSFFQHGHGEKAGTGATYFTLFKSFCGLGVLALPSAFRLAGYVGGTLGIIVIAGISHHCMDLLLQCAVLAAAKLGRRHAAIQKQAAAKLDDDKDDAAMSSSVQASLTGGTSDSKGGAVARGDHSNSTSNSSLSVDDANGEHVAAAGSMGNGSGGGVGDDVAATTARLDSDEKSKKVVISFSVIGELAMGKIGSRLVDVCLVFSQIGFSTAYLIFIGSNVFAVVGSVGSPTLYIFVAAAAVIPLVWLQDLKHLALTSLMADAAILFGIITIFAYDLIELKAAGFDSNAKSLRVSTLPLFFGVAVFAFEGIGLVLPVQQTMEKPEDMPSMLRTTMLVLTVLFIAIGALSYMAYGAATADMITLNLPRNGLVSSVQLFYCLGLFFTYPVMMFPACKILEATGTFSSVSAYFMQRLRSSRLNSMLTAQSNDEISLRTFRLVLVFATAVVAVTTPHFTLFVNLIGSVACTMLAFVLPTIFYVRLVDNPTTMLYVKSAAIVIFGVSGGAICLVVTLNELYAAVMSSP